MKTVSIQDLKQNLSRWIDEAASGVRIVVTRHKEPIVYLESAERKHLHVGDRVGKGSLKPLLKNGSKGWYLDVLAEDRGPEDGEDSR